MTGSPFREPHPLLLGVFVALLVFRYLEGGFRWPMLGAVRFEFIVATLLTLVAVGVLIQRPSVPDRGLGDRLVVGFAVALLSWMAAMVPLSVSPAVSYDVFVNRPLKMAAYAVMITAFASGPMALIWILAGFLLSFLKMVQEGLVGYFGGGMVWENQGVPRLNGTTPSYGSPNSLGGTQVSTFPFLLHLSRLAPRWLKIGFGLQALGAAGVILFTGSRTAYLAFLGWVAWEVARGRRKARAILVATIAALALVPLIPASYVARFETIFTGQEIEGASTQTRKQILTDAWVVFQDHPMGVGVGAFPAVRHALFGRHQDTHNLYLEIATNLGIVGLGLFAGFVFAMFRTLRHVRRRCADALAQFQASPLGADKAGAAIFTLRLCGAVADAITAFLIVRLALGLFGHDLYEIYWWFAAGLTLAIARLVNTVEATSWTSTSRGNAQHRVLDRSVHERKIRFRRSPSPRSATSDKGHPR